MATLIVPDAPTPWPWAERLAAYASSERARGRREGGVTTYLKILARLAAFAEGRVPSAELVEGYFLARAGAGQLRPATIAAEQAAVASFARWGIRRRLVPDDVLLLLERPKKVIGPPIAAPRASILKVAAWVEEFPPLPKHVKREAAARARRHAALCLYAGLRLSEARFLSWHDCDLTAGELLVREGKGGKSRRVPLAPPLRRVLELVPVATRTGYVTGFADGRPLSNGSSEHLIDRFLSKLLGIDISAHMLRRAFAAQLDEQGVSLRVIQDLLGHSSLATTERYLAIDSRRKVAAMNLLDGGFGAEDRSAA
jgi:integrase